MRTAGLDNNNAISNETITMHPISWMQVDRDWGLSSPLPDAPDAAGKGRNPLGELVGN